MLSRETILEENGDSDGEGSEAGNNFKVKYPRLVFSFRSDCARFVCSHNLQNDPASVLF